ncbi:MAG: hypothetical protein IT305_13695 [Chloroflexi bacterium]|nr:hypothetical protein [Chloroflexota bacterium]
MARHARSDPSVSWLCPGCGGEAPTKHDLLDHQGWCQGDAFANVQLLDRVARRDGELTQEALVAEARRWRVEAEGGP